MKKLSLNKRNLSTFSSMTTVTEQVTENIAGGAQVVPCSFKCVSNVICADDRDLTRSDCYSLRCAPNTIIP